MDRKQQEQQAQQRQALLESKFSPQELQKVQQFNPKLAQNALMSAQLRDSKIEVLEK
jgi:hypothetical protein